MYTELNQEAMEGHFGVSPIMSLIQKGRGLAHCTKDTDEFTNKIDELFREFKNVDNMNDLEVSAHTDQQRDIINKEAVANGLETRCYCRDSTEHFECAVYKPGKAPSIEIQKIITDNQEPRGWAP